jgi:hypothetical protein
MAQRLSTGPSPATDSDRRFDSGRGPVDRAQDKGDDVANSAWFEWLARAGLVARGVIYAIVAVLAIKLALGDGGEATNQQGALKTIAGQPFGKALLVLMAIGLVGYALWKLIRAAIGHGPESGEDSKLERAGNVASGLIYGGLAITAVQIIAGSGGGKGKGGADQATGGVLDWPAGPVIVAIGGLVLIGVAIYQAYEGAAKKFLEKSKTEQMSEKVRQAFTRLGMAGYLARAVVFAMIGYGLVKAALDYDADKAVGLDGALAKLGQASYGPVLLGIVAAGLLAFAAYSVADSRYRKV